LSRHQPIPKAFVGVNEALHEHEKLVIRETDEAKAQTHDVDL
jgi:hypothetical protein